MSVSILLAAVFVIVIVIVVFVVIWFKVRRDDRDLFGD